MTLRLITFFLLLTSSINSQPNRTELIKQAVNFSYNFDFEKSDSCLTDFIAEFPEDAAGYIYTAQIHLWKYLGSKDPGELGIFWRYSDLAQNKEESSASGDFPKFFIGWNYLLRSIAYSSNDEMYDAFTNAKTAYGIFDDLIDDNPQFYDAYLGRGLIKYSLSFTPGVFRWILSVIGLDADKQSGFRDVKLAFENAQIVKPEAGFHYARFLRDFYADYKGSSDVLRNLAEENPGNLLYLFQLAIAEINLKNFGEAESVLHRIIQSENTDFPRTLDFAYFLLGECKYFVQDFETAKEFYSEFIRRARAIDFTGFANLRLAFCEEFLGNPVDSEKHLLLTGMGNENLDKDQLADKLTISYLAGGIPKALAQLEKADILLFVEKTKEAGEVLSEIDAGALQAEHLLKLHYLKAKALYSEKKFEEAESILINSDPSGFVVETQFKARFYLLLAKCKWAEGDSAKALYFTELAEDENNGFLQNENDGLINGFRKKMNDFSRKM